MAALATPDAAPKSLAPAATKGLTPNPFTKASKLTTEMFLDRVHVLGANSQQVAQVDVPATGYLRHIVLDVQVSGATGMAYKADAPWNLLEQVILTDVNGTPLVFLSGYELYLANLVGGYTQNASAGAAPLYSSTATGFRFQLRIPVEIIQRNAFGSLPNTNAAQTYKVKLTLAPIGDVTSAITGTASVRIRGIAESWSNPASQDMRGIPNLVAPPSVGVTQNWSTQTQASIQGRNAWRLARVGNTIRNIIVVGRTAAGARDDTVLPDDFTLLFDGRVLHQVPTFYLRMRFYELYGYALPTGVLVLPFTDDFDGTPGGEVGDYYMQTSGASRLEIQGTSAAAGQVAITTNDILAGANTGGAGATLGAQT